MSPAPRTRAQRPAADTAGGKNAPAPRTRAQRLAEAALTRIRAVAADWPADGGGRPAATPSPTPSASPSPTPSPAAAARPSSSSAGPAADASPAAAPRPSASPSRAQYKARADQFPVLVMQAGLAQALGFLRAKAGDAGGGENAYRRYLNDLAAVVGATDGEALQQQAIAAPLPAYRQLTRQVLAAAGWLKRFGQAYLGPREEAGNGAAATAPTAGAKATAQEVP